MGMSDDLDVALAEGSTMVRIGTAIFGPKKAEDGRMRIAFLGGGNMAAALIGGLIAKGTDARSISVIEVSPAARERLGARYPVHIATAPDAAMQRSDVAGARGQAAGREERARFDHAPAAAGASALPPASRCRRCRAGSAGYRKLVRCMPNTPALIGAGIAGLYALPEVSAEEKKQGRDHPRARWARRCGCPRSGCSIR